MITVLALTLCAERAERFSLAIAEIKRRAPRAFDNTPRFFGDIFPAPEEKFHRPSALFARQLRQTHEPRRFSEDQVRLVLARSIVKILRRNLARFDVKAVQILQPHTQDRRRNPEGTIVSAQHAIVGANTQMIKTNRRSSAHLGELAF